MLSSVDDNIHSLWKPEEEKAGAGAFLRVASLPAATESALSSATPLTAMVPPALPLMTVMMLVLTLSLVPGCQDPYSVTDDAVRDIDRPRAELEEMSDPVVLSPYDTRPTWSWESDPVEGTTVFRYRLNSGEWTVLPPGPPPYEYTPVEDLYPGTYRFEVQERNAAGTWSEACSHTTTVKVREPLITGGPPDPTNDASPTFTWEQWHDGGVPQYGATGLFSWKLETVIGSGGEWSVVASEGFFDIQDVLTYTIGTSLGDGLYRFCVAERNAGGALSTFVHSLFQVDRTPPGAPFVSGLSVVSDADPNPSVYTVAAVANDTFSEFLWELIGTDGVTIESSGVTGGTTLAVMLSEASGGPGIGTYTLRVRQRDAAANLGPPRIVAVSVEVLPLLALITPTPTNNPSPEFEIIGNDSGNVDEFFRWVINGIPSEVAFEGVPGNPGATFSRMIAPNLPDGTHTVAVQQRRTADAGYTASSTVVTVTIDTVAPDAPVVTGQPSGPTNDTTPTFSVTGEAGGIFIYTVSGATTVGSVEVEDGGATGSEMITLPLLNDGTNEVSIFIRDAAGNDGAATVFSVEIDTVDPVAPTGLSSVQLLGSAPELYIFMDTLTVTWEESEPGAFYEYRLQTGGAWIPVGAALYAEVGPIPVGEYQFAVRAIDGAGNTSVPSVELVFSRLDTGTITITNPPVPTFTMSPATFTLDAALTPEDSRIITVDITSVAGTISSYTWLINGQVVQSGAGADTLQVIAGWALDGGNPTLLGVNGLTLVVEIDGVPYSSEDVFFFTVVEGN